MRKLIGSGCEGWGISRKAIPFVSCRPRLELIGWARWNGGNSVTSSHSLVAMVGFSVIGVSAENLESGFTKFGISFCLGGPPNNKLHCGLAFQDIHKFEA